MRRSLRQAASALLVAAVLVALASPAMATERKMPARSPALTGPQVFAELLAWVGQWLEGVSPESTSAASAHGMDPDGSLGTTETDDDPSGSTTPQASHGMDPDG